jgi:hypothetical protein
MEFTLNIDCDNAAFSPDPLAEIQRLLEDAALKIKQGNREGILVDSNGHVVGGFTVTIAPGDNDEDQDEAENFCQNDEILYDLGIAGEVAELERIFRYWCSNGVISDINPDNVDFDKLVAFIQE